MYYCGNSKYWGGMDTEIRVSTKSQPWRKRLSGCSCHDLNPRPFDQESITLPLRLNSDDPHSQHLWELSTHAGTQSHWVLKQMPYHNKRNHPSEQCCRSHSDRTSSPPREIWPEIPVTGTRDSCSLQEEFITQMS